MTRNKDNLCTYRMSNTQDRSISDDVWRAWQEKWSQQHYIKKCTQASKNWLTEKCSPVTGPSKYTRGSRSMCDHERAMVRMKYSMLKIICNKWVINCCLIMHATVNYINVLILIISLNSSYLFIII